MTEATTPLTRADGELTGALPGKLLQSGSLNAAMA